MRILFFLFLFYYFLFSAYIRDEDSNTVLDTNTLVMWQDDIYTKSLDLTWSEALNYCENNVTLGGYNDWRVPNINELTIIIDHSIHSPSIHSVFSNIEAHSGGYWSSTTYMQPGSEDQAWYIDFIYGDTKTKVKTNTNKIRCIRDFK